MKSKDTSIQNAVLDIASNLGKVFKKYSRNTREQAWQDITSKAGEKEIQKIIQNPDRPINTFQQLKFKEWVYRNSES